MEIGNQIKQLRLRRGITQEAMAQHFGVTPQAVSKWERGAATPDIGMLPGLSAYFGVTIDELFALTDETRMERIENMVYDTRVLNPADVESARAFLVDLGRREPENGKPYALLALMENHLAKEHREAAELYAKESISRNPKSWDAIRELVHAAGGKDSDWNCANHYLLIEDLKAIIQETPDAWDAYMNLMDQLIDDCRLDEAEEYLHRFAEIDHSYRVALYWGKIVWTRGDWDGAFSVWKKMEEEFPEEWCVWHCVGDYLVRAGRYDEAMAYYRKALETQKAPRLLDPCDAMAQLCELRGDYAGAVQCRREQAALLEAEWNITGGETLDEVIRDISRLEKKMEK